MPAISAEDSLRLRLLNFPLIVGVVYIHAYSAEIDHAGVSLAPEHLNYLTDFVRTLISQGLARLAVPLFFLMSGYFFFQGFSWSWRGFGQKLAGRAKTLLLPYLFWTIFVGVIQFLGHSLPSVSAYFAEPLPAGSSVYHVANTVIGFTWAPAAYHLWFIRDLMILMLVSPLLFLLLRFLALPLFAATFLAWITANWPIHSPDVVGVLFFSLGGYLAMQGKSLFFLDRYGVWFVLLYIPVLLVDVIWYTEPFNLCLHRCGIVVGLVAVLYGSRKLLAASRLQTLLLRLSGMSFFVYAAHEPWLGIVRTVAFQFLPLNRPSTMILIYLLVPLAVIAALVALHAVLQRYIPGALRVVTGGR